MADYSDLFEPAPRNPNLAVRLNADANPEQEAEYLKLAKRYGAPVPVIRQFPDEYKARAKADDVDQVTRAAPAVRSFSPFRSASDFTGLRECMNTSAVRMNSGIDTIPSLSSR